MPIFKFGQDTTISDKMQEYMIKVREREGDGERGMEWKGGEGEEGRWRERKGGERGNEGEGEGEGGRG